MGARRFSGYAATFPFRAGHSRKRFQDLLGKAFLAQIPTLPQFLERRIRDRLFGILGSRFEVLSGQRAASAGPSLAEESLASISSRHQIRLWSFQQKMEVVAHQHSRANPPIKPRAARSIAPSGRSLSSSKIVLPPSPRASP